MRPISLAPKSSQLIWDALADAEREVVNLTKQLAKLGCSCTVKTRETDLEAHERFCRFRMAMEDMSP